MMGDVMTEFASKYETLLLRRERSRLHVTLNRPAGQERAEPDPDRRIAHGVPEPA